MRSRRESIGERKYRVFRIWKKNHQRSNTNDVMSKWVRWTSKISTTTGFIFLIRENLQRIRKDMRCQIYRRLFSIYIIYIFRYYLQFFKKIISYHQFYLKLHIAFFKYKITKKKHFFLFIRLYILYLFEISNSLVA